MDTFNVDPTGEVEGQDYYHINRLVHWSPYGLLNVGDEVDVGDATNPYFRFFETATGGDRVTYIDGSTAEVLDVRLLELVQSGKVVDVPRPVLVDFARTLASHLARLSGELVFEDVRRREFPHLPSRQRCI